MQELLNRKNGQNSCKSNFYCLQILDSKCLVFLLFLNYIVGRQKSQDLILTKNAKRFTIIVQRIGGDVVTKQDIQDGKKIAELFAILSEENKNMAIVYLSALRDKELADSSKDNRQQKPLENQVFGALKKCQNKKEKVKKKNKTQAQLIEQFLIEFNISTYLFDFVNDWIEYKKEGGFVYKETGLKNLIIQISESAGKYGDKAVAAVIKESIASGYKGIVFDKLTKIKREAAPANNFNNFLQREYDYNELEQKLLSNN